jgi:hypothetical protein
LTQGPGFESQYRKTKAENMEKEKDSFALREKYQVLGI